MKFLATQSGKDPWSVGPEIFKAALHKNRQVDVPPQERWGVGYLKSLLRMQVEAKLMKETVGDYIQALIDSLVR